MNSFRVATINLQSGASVTRGYWQYPLSYWKYIFQHPEKALKKAADFIRRNQIDVCLCTEASDVSLSTGFVSEATFFPTHAHGRISVEGSAVVSAQPILEKKTQPLTSGAIRRGIGQAVIEIQGRRVNFLVTHLSLSAPLRLIQMREIVDIVNALEGPVVLAGDFNTADDSLSYIERNSRLRECVAAHGAVPTFPSWRPRAPLDRIFISRDLKCVSVQADASVLFSDHLPLWAEIALG